jgi:hypothetical protein
VEDFFNNYLFKSPLVIKGKSNDYSHLLDYDVLDHLINLVNWNYPDLLLYKIDHAISAQNYTYKWKYINEDFEDSVDINKVINHFLDGHTIVLRSIERYCDPILSLCSNMETELGYFIHADAIVSPPHSHVNLRADYDGFLMQMISSGNYKIIQDQNIDKDVNTFEEEIIINPGESIYIPKNWTYTYKTDKEVSISILLVIRPMRWIDLFRLSFADQVKIMAKNLEYRKSLPVYKDGEQRDYKATFCELMDKVEKNLSIDNVRHIAIESFIKSSIHYEKGRLVSIESIKDIDFQSIIRRDELINYYYDENGTEIVLKFLGKTIIFPLRARISIKFILQNTKFLVRDIKGLISLEGKLEIVKRLVKEGLLKVN